MRNIFAIVRCGWLARIIHRSSSFVFSYVRRTTDSRCQTFWEIGYLYQSTTFAVPMRPELLNGRETKLRISVVIVEADIFGLNWLIIDNKNSDNYLVHNRCPRIPNCDIRTTVLNRLICICHHVGMDHVVHKHLLHSLVDPVRKQLEWKTNINNYY